ncbi:MAG: dihydrolipoamide acetyltransferase family protein [Phycisphaerales bacterium]|nr:dihydrolipoamide acetyltransferase family protein [Phycisphaerales bacterium]
MATKQPADQSHFILPDLGEGVHEAEIVRWRVTPGETVKEHQTLAEMETDKALVEVPSPWPGTVKELHGSEGDIVNVGNTLVTYDIGATGGSDEEPVGGDVVEPEKEDAGTVVGSVDSTLSVPTSFARRVEAPIADAGGKSMATPAVRRIARELDIDINAIQGTGRGGRVTASDVHAQSSGTPAAPIAPVLKAAQHAEPPASNMPLATPVALPLEGVAERIPFKGVRRKIAQALHHSVQTTVHFTVVDEADVTELEKKRAGLEQLLGRRLSLLPFVLTAVSKALRKHPMLNANVDDFVEEIHLKSHVHLGCAVDTEHGLMVPVIQDADTLSVVQLADAVTELASGCRDRSIDRERLTGGTFTISNVGSAGGAFATPIINYPEVAIMAVGRSRERVLTRDGVFYAGSVLPLSLSCDHRVVDGAEGARFLNTVTHLLQDPTTLLPQL